MNQIVVNKKYINCKKEMKILKSKYISRDYSRSLSLSHIKTKKNRIKVRNAFMHSIYLDNLLESLEKNKLNTLLLM